MAEVASASDPVQPQERSGTLSPRTRGRLLAAILVLAVGARAGSLIGPFGPGWQHLGATFSIIARNYLHYGLLETRLLPVLNPEPVPRAEWVRFTHHPPGMGLTTMAVMSVIGDGPLAIKLPGLLFSLLQVLVTYAVVARAVSPVAGLAAAFATAVLPAGAHYATHGSDLGPQAIAIALLALLLDERARERDPARPRSAAVLAASAASLFFGWPALVIVGTIGLRDLLLRNWRRALLFLAVPPVALGLQMLHLRWATGSFGGARGGSLLSAFLGHGLIGALTSFRAAGNDFVIARVARHSSFLFTNAGLLLAAGGLLRLGAMVRGDAELRRRIAGPFFCTLALAFGYSLPFARAVVVHRFWLIVALPWIALLIGIAFDGVWSWRRLRPATLTALLLIGAFATWQTQVAQAAERNPIYEELGTLLRTGTHPRELVFTSEHPNGSLDYYAERTLRGGLDDHLLETFAKTDPPPLAPGWIAIVQPPFDPPVIDCDELLAFLPRHYDGRSIALPESERTLWLFDLSRRPER